MHELYNAIQIRHVIVTLTLTIIMTFTRIITTLRKYITILIKFVMFDGKHVTRLHNGKNLEKTSKRNKTDSTKKCPNRGLNPEPEHKVAREVRP